MSNLYAEYLPNIKTLAITAVLETPRDDDTALWLTKDRTKLILQHADNSYRITLPAKVIGQGAQHLQLPSTGQRHCVNRVSAEPIFTAEETFIPWTASALDPQTELRCKQCNAVISAGNIRVWKDLPSEAWAEMMDLWHCHKPSEPEPTDDDSPVKKGYAAGNKLVAQLGVGLVDVMSFLLVQQDCGNIEIRESVQEDHVSTIQCKSCSSHLGLQDLQTQGIRLEKLHLALFLHGTPHSRSFTPEQWFSCYFHSTIEAQGVRKFVFSSMPYELWVFSTNLAYASEESPSPKQAMKVLYRTRQGSQHVETLRAANLLIETLTLTPRMEKLLLNVLQRQNMSLPESLRSFHEWDVAVLPTIHAKEVRVE